jgi:beta-galactosidase
VAADVGLKVVISTHGELHPLWIHRLIPDSYMINHMGQRVISRFRGECNVALTPGGCTDHPEVRERMAAFLRAVARQYASEKALYGYDCWNELRWNVQAYGRVCYCPYTVKAYRNWLQRKYDDLDGLNRAWMRRYVSWDDVHPGSMPDLPYTDMTEFCRFLVDLVAEHARFRYDSIRAEDPHHLITLHNATPSWMQSGDEYNQAHCRGNDWLTADQVDGIGCSHFPFWGQCADDLEFLQRIDSTRAAAGGKVMWLSELQGGAACDGLRALPSVDAESQQRWVWNGISRGAKAVIFWCWRDEVFGRECSGFGIVGNDGKKEQRLVAMARTGAVLKKYEDLFDAYQPDPAQAGVLIEPDVNFIEYAKEAKGNRFRSSISGYSYALMAAGATVDYVESGHLAPLDHLRLLVVPFPLVVRAEVADKLQRFVAEGGTLLIEGECDAYTPLGFYRYPGADRTFPSALGLAEVGRRELKTETWSVTLNNRTYNLKPFGWMTPYAPGDYEVLAQTASGEPVVVRRRIGQGQVIAAASFLGIAYAHNRYHDFIAFMQALLTEAGVIEPLLAQAAERVLCHTGMAGERRLAFLLNTGKRQKVTVTSGRVSIPIGTIADELFSGTQLVADRQGYTLELPEHGAAILAMRTD